MRLGGKLGQMMLKRKRVLYPDSSIYSKTFSTQEQFVENIQTLKLNYTFRIGTKPVVPIWKQETVADNILSIECCDD